MQNLKFRNATRKDVKEMAMIFRNEFRKKPYNEKWSEKDAEKRVAGYFHYSKLMVATIDGKIVGLVFYFKFFWHDGFRIMVDEVVVDSNYQGMGIGKKLIEKVGEIGKKEKVKVLFLYSHSDSKAFNFYKKLGFKQGKWISFEKELK